MNGSECFLGRHKIPVSLIYSPKQSSHQVATVATRAATEESSEVGVMQICNKQHTHTYIYTHIFKCLNLWQEALFENQLRRLIYYSQALIMEQTSSGVHTHHTIGRSHGGVGTQSCRWQGYEQWLGEAKVKVMNPLGNFY